MTADSTSPSPELARFVGGEQEGLPPAPEGAPDQADDVAPDDRFHAPEDGDLTVDEEVTEGAPDSTDEL
ncbi:hypothetical protein ACIQLK_10415 [Microbacterium sp. NPDC091382]|uniref:hypothetical protein n=1 Tax=Microbacterium sp. NPDC091382 TaxID=3364210 RepID=UPI0037FD9943